MINDKEHAELVRKAQLGDEECLNRLAEEARVRLREYVFRLTLQEDLTQDIVQESILEMFRVFNKLKRAERFWAWLHGIAFNKLRGHYGRQWRHKTTSLSDVDFEVPARDSHNALAGMVNRELKQVVIRSMQKLAPRHRAVLTLRCYEQMPYSKIAELMGCTEFGAQSLFYRAKRSLAKELSRHGLGKGYLLAALVLFGKMTATTEATAAKVSVTAASIKVSAAASLAAMVTSKTAVISLATAGVIAGGTVATTLGPDKSGPGLHLPAVNASVDGSRQTGVNTDAEQCWYFFPDGVGKPVMTRLLKSDASGKRSYCRHLQNQHANYHYDKNTIYISNSRMYNPDLSVWRLPTDGQRLSRFISQIEGRQADMEYVSARREGLLVISERSGDQGNRIWRIDRHFNVLEEEYFQFDWPASARIVDNRDAMHKRGWTYFRVSGRINGEQVSGTGRMPFVYETCKQYGAWLKLQLANGSKIVDTGAQACVFNGSGTAVARYEAGSFFKGLGRPWMGLHTIDTVRRDAAQEQVRFETASVPGGNKAEVVLTCEKVKLTYTIDMETDVIDKIALFTNNGGEGELRFSYLQNIDNLGSEFAQPRAKTYRQAQQEPPGMLWLERLMSGSW